MECASVFSDNFSAETIYNVFRDYFQPQSQAIILLFECKSLSLVEHDKTTKVFHLHPYIKWYVRQKITDGHKVSLELTFIRFYFDKLLDWSLAQAVKDKFTPTLDSVRLDSHNLKQFITSFCNLDLAAIDPNDVFPEIWKEQLCFVIFSCVNLLQMMSSFKILVLVFLEKLEKLMLQLNEQSAQVLCKCLIALHLRRRKGEENVEKSRNIITDAHRLCFDEQNQLNSNLALGVLCFTSARSIQHIKDANVVVSSLFDWEERSIADFYEESLKMYETITNSSETWVVKFWPIILCGKSRAMTELCRVKLELIGNTDPDALMKVRTKQTDLVYYLYETLGKHEEVAFTARKLADRIKFNWKDFKEASKFYNEAHQMYKSFGAEMVIQTAVVLKEWSDCCNFEDAIDKLQEAK